MVNAKAPSDCLAIAEAPCGRAARGFRIDGGKHGLGPSNPENRMSDYKLPFASHDGIATDGAQHGAGQGPIDAPRRVFHVERLTRYKSREMRFRVFEETPAGLRPLVNDNGRSGPEGVTYPFQTHHLDRHRRSEYQFAVADHMALDVLCRALARHFGEPIGVYRFGMTMQPLRIYDPSGEAASPLGPAEPPRSELQRGELRRGEAPVEARPRLAGTPA